MGKTEVRGGQILDGSVSLTDDVTGTLPAGNGGTGANTLTLNALLVGNGTGALQTLSVAAANRIVRSNGTAWGSSELPFFNVKDYGVVGDGSTDDTAAIQAVFDAVPSTGGVVWFPPGRYKISATLQVKNDCTQIWGAGVGDKVNSGTNPGSQAGVGTRFEAASGITGSVFLVQAASGTTPVYAAVFRDFMVDGQNVGTAVDGVIFRSNRALMQNVHFARCTGNGVVVRGYAGWATYDTVLWGVKSSQNGGHGFLTDTRGEDLLFIGCHAFGNTGDGVKHQASSQLMIGFHCYDNTGVGVRFNGSGTRSRVIDGKIEGNNGGIYVDGTGASHLVISGLNFKDNSQATTNTTDHIQINSSAGSNLIIINGNTFVSTVSNKARYGVNLANTNATNVLVSGNGFQDAGFGTKPINDAGSTSDGYRCVIRDNIGAPDSGPIYKALTDAATIAINVDDAEEFTVTLGGNRTLGTPSGSAYNLKEFILRVRQDGTGSRTLAYNSAYRFSTDVPSPTLSTGANKTDYLKFKYNSTDSKWDCMAVNRGF